MRYTFTSINTADEQAVLDRIWTASQDADDRAFRPRDGWWSLSAWAERGTLLLDAGTSIGGLALHPAPDGALEARLALLPDRRTHTAARLLVGAAQGEAQADGSPLLRLALPGAATWAREAAAAASLAVARATLVMSRPASCGPLDATTAPDITIRALAQGEEGRLVHALNHAWADTWNFRPLTRRALERDLTGQRDGFLIAVDGGGRIAGTVHAQFDASGQNPDGTPYAWIANLTTALEWRGRGLGRALLGAGIVYLHTRSARSITLGVDSGATAPIALYRSAGFTEIDRLELWERACEMPAP
jgi:ribosomal protein S18 acetylase RimI-like enzyme